MTKVDHERAFQHPSPLLPCHRTIHSKKRQGLTTWAPSTFKLIQEAHQKGIKHIFTTDLDATEWKQLTDLDPQFSIYQPVHSSACYVLGQQTGDTTTTESTLGKPQETGGILRETFMIGQQVYSAQVQGRKEPILLTYDEAVDVIWQALGGSVRVSTILGGECANGEMYLTATVPGGKESANFFSPDDTFKVNRLVAHPHRWHGLDGSCVATYITKDKRLRTEEAASLLTAAAIEPRLLLRIRHRNGRAEWLQNAPLSQESVWSTVDKTGLDAVIKHISEAKTRLGSCRSVVTRNTGSSDMVRLQQGTEKCLVLDRDGDRQFLHAMNDIEADIFPLALKPLVQSGSGRQPAVLGKDQIWEALSKKLQALTPSIDEAVDDALSIEGEASDTEIDLEAQELPRLDADSSGTAFPSSLNLESHMMRKQLWEGKRALEIVQSDQGPTLIWRRTRDSRSLSTSVAERSIVLTEPRRWPSHY